ncbi:MAG: DUF2834 domain-containing protein [Nevskia sp.]|nr:DUF2834 domain-containing protein [Nevskia sp.]
MTATDKLLMWLYLALALIALYATWSHNLEFLALPGHGGGVRGFIELAYANPAAGSMSNDIVAASAAGFVFMLAEARRLKIRYVWVYIVLSAAVAFSAMFALFLAARQMKLAAARQAG